MTWNMAESLVEIDPNMESKEEGYAFIRKLYQTEETEPESTKTQNIPDTPSQCLKLVAGKFILIEDLQNDIDKADGIRRFFSEVYCGAYVNALVTNYDGLNRIEPGNLDAIIVHELQRLYGPFDME